MTDTNLQPFYVGTAEAARLSGVGKSTWYNYAAQGLTPKRVLVCGRWMYRVEDLKRQHLANQKTTPSSTGA
jgi:predicted site-specific integrase-resolvase